MTPQFESYVELKETLKVRESALITFETEEELATNELTMSEFLDLFDIPEEDIHFFDGTYVELKIDDTIYRVDASGNGDFRSHKIEIEKLNEE